MSTRLGIQHLYILFSKKMKMFLPDLFLRMISKNREDLLKMKWRLVGTFHMPYRKEE